MNTPKATSFGSILRARLLALMEARGTNPTNLSISMGHAGSTLGRKLDGRRRLCTSDVEEVLAALGEPAEAVFRPVLLDGDREALAALWRRQQGGTPTTFDDFEGLSPGRLNRLAGQALLATDADQRIVSLTSIGLAVVLA